MNFNWDSWCFENKNQDSSRIAFSCSDTELTWQQLHDKTLKLKNLLLANSTKIQGPIIIYGHKESLFPISIIACLMAKMPYVPVDTINPLNRLRKIGEICGANTIVNCTAVKLPPHFQNEITSDNNFLSDSQVSSRQKIDLPENLAYILFTSGSSGAPKGVMISRDSLKSFNQNILKSFFTPAPQVYFNQALFSFDISLFEFCLTLSTGGTCVLFSNSLLKIHLEFISTLKIKNCSFWNSTPSFLQLCLMQKEFNAENIPSLRNFMLMGETIPEALVSKLKSAFPNSTLYNGYGPTEATVIVGYHQIQEIVSEGKIAMSDFPSTQITLTDLASTEQNPSEIIIIGNQVAEGYLTIEDELNDAFFSFNNNKAFKTGDLGYVKNNKLYFHSRKDDQIKYHGYRIEPLEIDHILMQHSSLKFCITIPLLKNNKTLRLLTFIPKSLNPLITSIDSFDMLHDFLEKELPAYMAKPEFILVKELPYNSSFKVDKSLLIENYLAG